MDRSELLRASARLWRELASSSTGDDAKTLLAMARELDVMAAELDTKKPDAKKPQVKKTAAKKS